MLCNRHKLRKTTLSYNTPTLPLLIPPQKLHHRIHKLLGPLTNHPMPTIDIHKFEPRKEPTDDRQHLITHIATLRPANKQRPLIKPTLLWIRKWKIRHVVQRAGQDVNRNAKPERLSRLVAHEVRQQELADGQIGGVRLQDGIRVLHAHGLCGLDFAHALCVLWKVAAEGCIDGSVVDGDDVGAAVWVAEGHGHDDFGAHGVADEGAVGEVVGGEEGFDVGCHGGVVVGFVMGGVAMVAGVEGVDGAGEGAGEDVCDALVVSFTAKQAMNHDYRVSFCLAIVIVESVCEVYGTQRCRGVK